MAKTLMMEDAPPDGYEDSPPDGYEDATIVTANRPTVNVAVPVVRPPTPGAKPLSQAMTAYQRGLDSFLAGDRAGAETHSKEAIRIDPNLTEASRMLDRLRFDPKSGTVPMVTEDAPAVDVGSNRNRGAAEVASGLVKSAIPPIPGIGEKLPSSIHELLNTLSIGNLPGVEKVEIAGQKVKSAALNILEPKQTERGGKAAPIFGKLILAPLEASLGIPPGALGKIEKEVGEQAVGEMGQNVVREAVGMFPFTPNEFQQWLGAEAPGIFAPAVAMRLIEKFPVLGKRFNMADVGPALKEFVLTKNVKIPVGKEEMKGFYTFGRESLDPWLYEQLTGKSPSEVKAMLKDALAGKPVFLEKRVSRFSRDGVQKTPQNNGPTPGRPADGSPLSVFGKDVAPVDKVGQSAYPIGNESSGVAPSSSGGIVPGGGDRGPILQGSPTAGPPDGFVDEVGLSDIEPVQPIAGGQAVSPSGSPVVLPPTESIPDVRPAAPTASTELLPPPTRPEVTPLTPRERGVVTPSELNRFPVEDREPIRSLAESLPKQYQEEYALARERYSLWQDLIGNGIAPNPDTFEEYKTLPLHMRRSKANGGTPIDEIVQNVIENDYYAPLREQIKGGNSNDIYSALRSLKAPQRPATHPNDYIDEAARIHAANREYDAIEPSDFNRTPGLDEAVPFEERAGYGGSGQGELFTAPTENIGQTFERLVARARTQGMTIPEAVKYARQSLAEQSRGQTKTTGGQNSIQREMGIPGGVEGFGRGQKGQGSLFEEQEKYGTNAPVFYSQLQRTIAEKMPNSAPVSMVKALIDPSKGNVKAEDVEWSGINEFLQGKEKVSKAELLDFLKSNEVEIKEVVKQNPWMWSVTDPKDGSKKYFSIKSEALDYAKGISSPNLAGIFENMQREEKGIDAVKFASYQLPGGSNYREVLLTLPNIPDSVVKSPQGTVLRYDRNEFKSSHFDEPNILAHVRMNDRTTTDGKRVLFLEEVQSDWHQKGREQGYRDDKFKVEAEKRLEEIRNAKESLARDRDPVTNMMRDEKTWHRLSDEQVKITDEYNRRVNDALPNAPFKKSWHELALKRMLRYAVDNGYDGIAWTTGEQQAERYDLSKQVEKIDFTKHKDGTVDIWVFGKNDDDPVFSKTGLSSNELSDHIGKESAQKIIGREFPINREGNVIGQLSGLDLKVGGEGMKGFYDKIITSFLNKYTKKWGGRVGESEISRIGEKPNKENFPEAITKVHSLDITPAMRESVAQGQALFERPAGYKAAPGQLDLWRPTPEGQHQRPVDIPKAIKESVVVKELKDTGFLDVHTTTIASPEDTAAIFSFMQNNNMESMYAIGMDGAGKMLGVQMVGMGNINQIPLSTRDTLAGMHAMGAAKVSFVHNHPSHDATPSKQDIGLTQNLTDLAKSVDMEVLHHVVINDKTFGLIHPDGRVEMRPFSHPKPATGTVRTVAPKQKWDSEEYRVIVNQPEIAADLLFRFQQEHPGVVLLALNTKNRVNSIWHVSSELPINPGKLVAEIGKISMRNAAASVIVSTNETPNSAYVKAIKSRLSPWGVDLLDWVGYPGGFAPITSARQQGIIGESKASYGTPVKESGGGYGGKPPTPPVTRGSDFGSGDAYKANRELSKRGSFIHYKAVDILKSAKDLAETILTPISTVLKNIDPSLKVAIRHHIFGVLKNTHDDIHAALPFMKRADRMSKDDQADLDLAGKNGDMDKIREIMARHGAWAEYDAYRRTMDELRKRAIDSGVDMGYLPSYFPRIVQDKAGFLDAMQADTRWPEISSLIDQAEAGGRLLAEDEKISIINNYLRGYANGVININKPGNVKTRTIEVLSPQLNQFYMDWRPAAIRYMERMNKMIGDRMFFGKHAKETAPEADLFVFHRPELDVEKSIGSYVLDVVKSGRVKPLDEGVLKNTLDAYFNQKAPGLAIQIYRDITTMQTIGNVIGAMTQIQDIDKAITRAPFQTVPALIKAIGNRSGIKLQDLGLDVIAEEFSTRTRLSRMVSGVLKLSGLTSLDRITAETPINAIVQKYRSQARRGMTGGLEDRLRAAVGEKWETVAEDLAEGKTTPDVLELAFNELLNIQPKALTELPRGYLKGGNARIFYMLKTFQLRQLDYIRNEVFSKMAEPGMQAKAVGMGRLLAIIGVFGAMGMGVDALKDWVLGRKTEIPDRVTDNILKISGLSKWTIYKARQEGIGSALMKTILPPAPMVDQLWKDFAKAGDGKGLESVQSIPVVGKPYYWRFGRGRQKTMEKHPELRAGGQKTAKAKTRTAKTGTTRTRKAVVR